MDDKISSLNCAKKGHSSEENKVNGEQEVTSEPINYKEYILESIIGHTHKNCRMYNA